MNGPPHAICAEFRHLDVRLARASSGECEPPAESEWGWGGPSGSVPSCEVAFDLAWSGLAKGKGRQPASLARAHSPPSELNVASQHWAKLALSRPRPRTFALALAQKERQRRKRRAGTRTGEACEMMRFESSCIRRTSTHTRIGAGFPI